MGLHVCVDLLDFVLVSQYIGLLLHLCRFHMMVFGLVGPDISAQVAKAPEWWHLCRASSEPEVKEPTLAGQVAISPKNCR